MTSQLPETRMGADPPFGGPDPKNRTDVELVACSS